MKRARSKVLRFKKSILAKGKEITWGPQIFQHIKNEVERINFYLLEVKTKVRNTNGFWKIIDREVIPIRKEEVNTYFGDTLKSVGTKIYLQLSENCQFSLSQTA